MNLPSEKPARRRPRRQTRRRLGASQNRWWDAGEESSVPNANYREYAPRGSALLDLWDWLHRARFIIAAVSLLVPVFFIARTKPFQSRWNLRHPSSRAEELIARNDFDPSRIRAFSRAVEQRPEKPDYWRALAKASAESEPSLARHAYDEIDRMHATSPEDAARHAALLAKLHAFTDANAVLDRMGDARRAPVLLRARLTVAIAEGNFKAASEIVAPLSEVSPDDGNTFFDATRAASQAGAPSALVASLERAGVRAFANRIQTVQGKRRNEEAANLLAFPLRDPANRERVRQIIDSLPDATPDQRLASSVLAVKPGARDGDALRRVCREQILLAGGFSALEKDRAATFLESQGEHQLVAELIAGPESLTDTSLFAHRLNALLQSGAWREAVALVSSPRAPTPKFGGQLFTVLGSLNKNTSAATIASDMIVDALKEACAEGRESSCYALGCAAVEARLPDVAGEAFACAVKISPDKSTAVENVVDAARRGGLALRDTLRAVTIGLAGARLDEELQERLCYLQLLVGESSEGIRKFIASRKPEHADCPYFRLIEALEHHRRGDYSQSFSLLVPLPEFRWHQGEAAVIAGIVCSAGGVDRCSSLIRSINASRIFPEEKAMLSPWQTRLSMEGTLAHPHNPVPAQTALR